MRRGSAVRSAVGSRGLAVGRIVPRVVAASPRVTLALASATLLLRGTIGV